MAESRIATSQVDGRRKEAKQEHCEMCQEKQSIGYCSQCKMFICKSCFDLHRRSRPCRSHVLLDAPDSSETSDHYESCTKHDHQPIKFYCSGHKFFGCGECILAGHTMCKYEHISGASRRFQENGQLARFLEEIQSLESNHKECIDNIDEQTEATSSMEQSAEDDIESFAKSLITYVTKAKKIALEEVKSKGLTSKQQIDKLKDVVEAIGTQLEEVTASFRNEDRVNKLFILAVEYKPKVASIRNALSTVDRNVITEFSFQPSKTLKGFASNVRPLGIFTDISEAEKKDPNFRFTMSQTSEKCVDPRDIIQDDLVKLTSIQDSLLGGPDQDACKQMGEIMGDITKSLQTNISYLTLPAPTKTEQTKVSVQDKIPNREPSPEKNSKSGWSFSIPFSKKPKKKVQIMNPTLTQTTSMFTSAMVKIMEDYDWMILGKNDPYDKQIPLIVVCPNSSRQGPDVDLALETIERPFHHAVVIIHTGSEANLPAIPSRKKIVNYKEATFIDVGFEQHSGIFNCRHNNEANKRLNSFIKRFYENVK